MDEMGKDRQIILVCGPESSGKSTISRFLTNYYQARLLPDYSRFYLTAYGKSYHESDVILMAEIHQKQFRALQANKIMLDTYLLNYKIWLQVKYGLRSSWLDKQLENFRPDACLLMKPDIEWEADPLRENKTGRMKLFHFYQEALQQLDWPFAVVDGGGDARNTKSLKVLDDLLSF